jgi:hypothetical protein
MDGREKQSIHQHLNTQILEVNATPSSGQCDKSGQCNYSSVRRLALLALVFFNNSGVRHLALLGLVFFATTQV